MDQLQDKVAVITGGGSGLGRACARRFVAEGATVVLGDVNDEATASAVAELEGDGGTAHAVHLDSSVPADNDAMIRTALDKFGRVDIVVAAAGLSHAGYVSGETTARATDGLLDQSPEDWQRVMDVNLTGVMLTNQSAARAMIDVGNGGAIINIASAAARIPLPGAVDYCVSKAGVAMLTKAFALEMIEHDIRINAIGPGFIETPMTARMSADDEGRERMIGYTPMGRLGQPSEIADAALFLASDQSSYMTGEIIFPAGGMFLG